MHWQIRKQIKKNLQKIKTKIKKKNQIKRIRNEKLLSAWVESFYTHILPLQLQLKACASPSNIHLWNMDVVWFNGT